jgi:hypothetical protein
VIDCRPGTHADSRQRDGAAFERPYQASYRDNLNDAGHVHAWSTLVMNFKLAVGFRSALTASDSTV